MTYAEWFTRTKSLGGTPLTVPLNSPAAYQQYVGRPAGRYPVEVYRELADSGAVDASALQFMSNSGAFVYVVAPTDAWTGAPQTMTNLQRAENAAFTAGDEAAGAVGLPSLADVESFLKRAGLWLGVAAVVGAVLLRRGRRR